MTMLEKAARAIHAHWMHNYQHGAFTPDRTPYDDLSNPAKEYALGQARAVLEAVRDGFLDMDTDTSIGPAVAAKMIGHILSESDND